MPSDELRAVAAEWERPLVDIDGRQQNSTDSVEELNANRLLEDTLGEPVFTAYRNMLDAESNFNETDANGNKFLEPKELDTMANKHLYASNIWLNRHEIEEESNDEYFDENDGVTGRDLENRLRSAIEDLSARGSAHEEGFGVEINFQGNADLDLHRLQIKDKNRNAEINWHSNGNFEITKQAKPGEVTPTNVEELLNLRTQKRRVLGNDTYSVFSDFAKLSPDKEFDKVDKDLNGHIDYNELYEYENPPSGFDRLSSYSYQEMDWIRDRVENLQEASNDEWGDENDGITQADLKAAIGHAVVENRDEIEANIENRLRSGMPGSRRYSSEDTELADTTGGVTLTHVDNKSHFKIEDKELNVAVRIDLQHVEGNAATLLGVEVTNK